MSFCLIRMSQILTTLFLRLNFPGGKKKPQSTDISKLKEANGMGEGEGKYLDIHASKILLKYERISYESESDFLKN